MKGACFPDFRNGGGAGGVLKPRHLQGCRPSHGLRLGLLGFSGTGLWIWGFGIWDVDIRAGPLGFRVFTTLP